MGFDDREHMLFHSYTAFDLDWVSPREVAMGFDDPNYTPPPPRSVFDLQYVSARDRVFHDIDAVLREQYEDLDDAVAAGEDCDHEDVHFAVLLGEEFGKVCGQVMALSPRTVVNLRRSLVQLAAITVAWLEALDKVPPLRNAECAHSNSGILGGQQESVMVEQHPLQVNLICGPCTGGWHRVCVNAINPRTPCTCKHEESPMSCCGALPSEHFCRGICPNGPPMEPPPANTAQERDADQAARDYPPQPDSQCPGGS